MATSRSIEFTDENIRKIFGAEDAESEPIERLKEYYFKNDTFNQVIADLPVRILVGHKGVGKSALFRVAISEDKEKENLPILIRPDDIAEIGEKHESLILNIRKWKFGLTDIIAKKVLNEFGVQDEAVTSKIIKFGGRIINLLSESVKSIKDNINLLPSQKILIENFLTNKKIIVYLDDLDRGWENRKEGVIMISALLNAIRDMSNENPGLSFKLSLRSDVYAAVRTSDESSDKIDGSVVWHYWTFQEILVMLIKRIETFFGEKINEEILIKTEQRNLSYHLDCIFEKYYHGFGKWETVRMHRLLMTLIRKRPRDLVKLCTLAARKANKNKHHLIMSSDIDEILEEYSHGRIDDTIIEYQSELPSIQRLLFGMKPNQKGKTTSDNFLFTTDALNLKINKIIEQGKFVFANGRPAGAHELAQFLYKINFLIARKEINGKTKWRFFDENKYLSSTYYNLGYDWEIHPAYRWALQPDSLDDIFNKLDAHGEE